MTQGDTMYTTPIKGSVTIMGTQVYIIIDDTKLDEYEADGLYHNGSVYLRSEYDSLKDYLVAYRHECIHALCDILGVQLDNNLEEILAHTVSSMITLDI